jgi:type IV pilus assembly protein PilC
MKFIYKAQTKDGRSINGTFEGQDKQALIAALTKQGAKPLLIRVAGGNENKKDGPRRSKVKLRDRVIFTRQLSTMVSAGVPLPRSLATLGGQAENKYFKSVIAGISKDVESGISLGEAFGRYPDVFSEVYINMVKAGEAGGILDEILKRLAGQIEKDATIRKKIKGAMTYPTVLLSITFIAFFGLMIFVIPKIGKILHDLGGPNAKLPIYTQVLLNISSFSISNSIIKHIPGIGLIPIINHIPNLLFMLGAAGIAGFYILRYIKTPVGKYKFHALMLKVPVLNALIIKIAVARFARTFASLTSAGVTVLDALEVTGGAIGNKVIEKELIEAAKEVRNGRPLSEPILASKHFPPIVGQMLAVGEETGQIDTILIKVADFYDEEVDTVIDSLSSIIEPVMIVIMGSIVGLIAASVMGPITSLSQNISGDSG